MKALTGLRLLDLTHILSGPYAGMILADLGAEAIKIEPPERGESTRRLLEYDPDHSWHGMGAYFLSVNRNKKSITLNLKTTEGLALFYQLVKTADIVLDNFSPGVTDRLKISYAHLVEIKPEIITCSITGFGQTGPAKDRVAFDIVSQAIAGGMSISGAPDGPPMRFGPPIGDLGSGLMAVIGILAAVVARQQTGQGQHVDISMQDTQISLLNYIATMYLLSNQIPHRMGNAHPVHVPYNAFPVQDGYIIVAVITDGFWKSLVKILDLPELDTPENEGQPGRKKNQAHINQCLSDRFRTNTQAYWLETLNAARIPCGPVNNIAQALADPQIIARNMVVEVPHTIGGTVKMPGNPIKLSATTEETFTSPPTLGEHTDLILQTLLGKTEEEIATLRQKKII